jgi:beta-glucosidase/6-phospho-beta-glucosidase/beta-galactosidase
LYIVENGCVENADGFDRVAYLNVHLKQVQRALAEGVKVAGYLCWSITTNRELGQKLTPSTDFGLYHIDLDTDENLERKPTPAAENYKEIIKHYKV